MDVRKSESTDHGPGASRGGVQNGRERRDGAADLARIAERIINGVRGGPAATPAHFVERINRPILLLLVIALHMSGAIAIVVAATCLALVVVLNLLVVLVPRLWDSTTRGGKARKRTRIARRKAGGVTRKARAPGGNGSRSGADPARASGGREPRV